MKHNIKFIVINVILWLLWVVSPTFAQSFDPPFVSDNNGTLYYEGGNGIYTNLLTADNISYAIWNADGTKLAFIKDTHVSQSNDVREIGYIEFNTDGTPTSPIVLQSHRPSLGYHISWMRDGRLMFVADHPESNPQTGLFDKRDLWAVTIGDTPELIGTFTPVGECGGGSDLPVDWVYWQEIGGFGVTLLLADTPYGILYSYSCSGAELALMDIESGESTPVASNLSKAVVSPNGEFVAGIELVYSTQPVTSQLTVYNIGANESEVIVSSVEPDLVAWNTDGAALYYSTRIFSRNAVDALTDDQRTLFYRLMGYEMSNAPEYKVKVVRVSLTDATSALVYRGDAYAIGRIFETPTALYISLVPNPMLWIDQILMRNIAVGDVDASLDAVQVGLMRLDRQGDGFSEEIFLGFYEKFTPYITSTPPIAS